MNILRLSLLGMVVLSILVSGCGTSAPRLSSDLLPAGSRTAVSSTATSYRPALVITHTPTPSPTFTPTATPTETPRPIRAVGVSYDDVVQSRSQVPALQAYFTSSGVNMVSLTAGRVDWTYFRWEGHPAQWSSAVKETNIDYLSEDCANFAYGHLNAIVDIYAPRYIDEHPEAAAISYWGEPSDLLVSTAALTSGRFNELILEMLDYIAANYPVDSISITELSYRIYGYGDDDLALYRAYSGRDDWPRDRRGNILFDHPSIGEWRSAALAGFLAQAAEVVHAHDKELFFDVSVSWGNLSNEASEYGQHYGTMLNVVDRIVVWAYTDLEGYPPSYAGEIAAYLSRHYRTDQFILSIGLWRPNNKVVSPEVLAKTVASAMKGGSSNLWVTPTYLITEAHWQQLADVWQGE